MGKLKYGIVGIKGMGAAHAKELQEMMEVELYAACDIDEEALKKFTAENNVAHAFTDYEEFLRSDVEAVSIVTPHFLHHSQALAAIEAGKHTLIEKPMTITVREADDIVEAVERRGVKAGVCFQHRTAPHIRSIKSLLPELGEVSRGLYEAWHFRTQAYYNSGDWRGTWWGEGGGVLANQAIHDLDTLQWLLGVLPKRVVAMINTYAHDIEVEDLASAIMELPSGGQVLFQTSTINAPGFSRIEFGCDRGALMFNGGLRVSKLETSARDFIKSCQEVWGSPKSQWQEVSIEIEQVPHGHGVIVKDFVKAILNDATPIVPVHEGRKSIELLNAIILSSFTARPVEVPVDRQAYDRLLERLKKGKKPKPRARLRVSG